MEIPGQAADVADLGSSENDVQFNMAEFQVAK